MKMGGKTVEIAFRSNDHWKGSKIAADIVLGRAIAAYDTASGGDGDRPVSESLRNPHALRDADAAYEHSVKIAAKAGITTKEYQGNVCVFASGETTTICI